jgi:hypothetical protein
MLDLNKLALQMQGIGQHLSQEADASRLRLERARSRLVQAQTQQATLVAQQQQWHDRLGFAAAEPVEPIETRVAIAPAPPVHTAIATDGSQIAPSHHEIAYCYLINIGRVVLHYGQGRYPLLDSVPEVFYRPEDLYGARQWGLRTDEWIGHRRTIAEVEALAALGGAIAAERTAADPPILALIDGSLLYWFLESLPNAARDRILPPILAAWAQLREAGVPLVSYLSASRSREVMNFLRLPACPHPAPDCATHCPDPDTAPCNTLEPLRDTTLWAELLQPGERGPLWRSTARIVDHYVTDTAGDQRVYFCHLHVGAEVARIEMPAWVAEHPAQRDQALALVLAQAQKGYGYPVAIAEAHNQAVVRGDDRARFFALLEQQMLRAGLANVGISYKEARKRGSIA